MKIRLLGDRVLVVPDKAQEMARGLHLVQKWRGPVTTGIVHGVGSEVGRRGLSLKEGQRVLVRPHSGTDFEHGDLKGQIFECRDILMVLSGLDGIEVSE